MKNNNVPRKKILTKPGIFRGKGTASSPHTGALSTASMTDGEQAQRSGMAVPDQREARATASGTSGAERPQTVSEKKPGRFLS